MYRFFAGKGGVGKTTLAAATALRLADKGRRVLVVSTDPAHSLGDALGMPLGLAPARVPRRRGSLHAVELSARRALAAWLAPRRRALVELAADGTLLDAGDVEALLDLWPPGGDELVGLLELSRLSGARRYDVVVVDTAPTGHTLRLLAMPDLLGRVAAAFEAMRARHRAVVSGLLGRWREGPADAVAGELSAQARALAAALRDPGRTAVVWVLLPEALALEETVDGVRALRDAGIPVTELVVNRLTPAPPSPCRLCRCRVRRERAIVSGAARRLPGLPVRLVLARPTEPRGPAALGRVLASGADRPPAPRSRRRPAPRPGPRPGTPWDVEELAPPGTRLLLVVGKGGVGKSTCAAALALALAARDPARRHLLLSADPAHSLGDVLGATVGDEPRPVPGAAGRLAVREIDAARAFAAVRARYVAAVDELFGALAGVAHDRAVVRRLLDLAPPGLDEMVAALSLLDVVDAPEGEAPVDLAVLDAAPTGHALRLLETPATAREWARALLALLLKYRPIARLGALGEELLGLSRRLGRLEALLRDAARTGVVVVARPGALPAAETARLAARLEALGVPLRALLANALTPPGCHRCARGAATEATWLGRLRRGAPARTVLLAPALCPPPVGPPALRRFAGGWRRAALRSRDV